MKTFEIIRSKGKNQNTSKEVINQYKTPNSLKVGREITLVSNNRGLGNRIKILVATPFPFIFTRKNKGGLLQPQQMVMLVLRLNLRLKG
jgi:hypothetical protein